MEFLPDQAEVVGVLVCLLKIYKVLLIIRHCDGFLTTQSIDPYHHGSFEQFG